MSNNSIAVAVHDFYPEGSKVLSSSDHRPGVVVSIPSIGSTIYIYVEDDLSYGFSEIVADTMKVRP